MTGGTDWQAGERKNAGRKGANIEGVTLRLLGPLHVDHRGSLLEVIDEEDQFWREPIVYAYRITILPGRIKGWGMHQKQDDRYFIAGGRLRVVLYDGRDDSPSLRGFQEFFFVDQTPALLRIPAGVWHADQNIGDSEATIINFPTRRYDHSNPDKFRIDPHSGEIDWDWTLRDS